MNQFQSKIQEKGQVSFPEFKGEKVYMTEFFQKNGLPEHLKRWQKTVDQMLVGIKTDEPIYLMIDQAFIPKGEFHRRPGLHIDGYWNPEKGSHGNHGGGKLHGKHGNHKGSLNSSKSWEESAFEEHEALILASNISASRGFEGNYSGVIKEGGDCDHLSTQGLKEVNLEANKVYVGNVTFLHESLKVKEDCYRTLVRLNVPGYSF